MAEPVTLRAVLSDYPHTVALKSGARKSSEVRLAFDEIEPVHKAFAPMVREGAWDLCGLAVVTALQAIAFDRPAAGGCGVTLSAWVPDPPRR